MRHIGLDAPAYSQLAGWLAERVIKDVPGDRGPAFRAGG